MRVVIIGNPIAGKGAASSRIAELSQCLRSQGTRVTTRMTRGPGDVAELARTIDDGVDCLVIAGGDGTIHATLNGLADPSATPIAILRAGTANVLARDLDLPRTPDAVATMIRRGRTRHVDMGIIGSGRRFLMITSAGFDAMVIKTIHARRRNTLGFWGYPLPILKTMLAYRAPTLRVTVPGTPPVEGALVVVANTFTYAGIMRVASRARCDSGHLDVVVFPCGSVPSLTRYALAGWRHQVDRIQGVRYLTGDSVHIDSPAAVDVEVDGEYYGTTPVDITLKPATVPLLVPG